MKEPFFQEVPELTNTFQSNPWLRAYLARKLPADYRKEVESDLERLGGLCAGPYLELARRAEREKPELVSFDPWGRRLDEIRVSTAWRDLQDISAREGLIHIGYKRRFREYSRLFQFSKLYLFHPSSAFFTCPLAMTDGAAKVLELYGRDAIHQDALKRLTANKPEEFWTSGQWMTEKTGGSDVSDTSTVAKRSGSETRLYGVKWFSSSTTSDMALALGRYEDSAAGSRGLTLFMVPLRVNGVLNNIQVLRLKDKLGTWALPTAELELQGALAYPVGERDHGVKTVATMLNITRLYNSICSVGQMTRAMAQLVDYSSKRRVFGAPLMDQPLHRVTFAREQIKTLAGFLLTMEMVQLLGREECGIATAVEQDMLRLFTPITKLFTAKIAIQVSSEVVEGFGGAGYVEDTGIPVHLRDSQVFSIWEGATNVLSLDLIRVIQKTSALASFQGDVRSRVKSIRDPELALAARAFSERWSVFERTLARWQESAPLVQAASSRDLAFQLAWCYAYSLLLSWADAETPQNKKIMAAWLALMERELAEVTLKTDLDCQNSATALGGRLEV